jgi:hypothetical protein
MYRVVLALPNNPSLEHLEHSEELRAVTNAYRTDPFVGADATIERLFAATNGNSYDVFHFGGHATEYGLYFANE